MIPWLWFWLQCSPIPIALGAISIQSVFPVGVCPGAAARLWSLRENKQAATTFGTKTRQQSKLLVKQASHCIPWDKKAGYVGKLDEAGASQDSLAHSWPELWSPAHS